jgi:FdhD protein
MRRFVNNSSRRSRRNWAEVETTRITPDAANAELSAEAIRVGLKAVEVTKHAGGHVVRLDDWVPVEEPLELRIGYLDTAGNRAVKALAVTMRTPGHDDELALGFLLTEGLLDTAAEVQRMHSPAENVVQVELADGVKPALHRLERNFYTTSSCGVCGKVSLAAVHATVKRPLGAGRPVVGASLVPELPERLRAAQRGFDHTGGIHAAGLFDVAGNLLCIREDVGRHNAVDKVIGASLQAGRLLGAGGILVVSGRASFELVQKAVVAGIPILAAVGAPSSLAIGLAKEAGATLLGFVRPGRFNVYTGGERIDEGR